MRIRRYGTRLSAIAFGTALALALLPGCNCGNSGDSDSGGGGDAGTDSGPPGDPYGYVTTVLRLPAMGEMLGQDLDGDGSIDNALGGLLQALATFVGMSFDAQMSIDDQLATGDLVMLWYLTNVNSFDADPSVGLDFYLGDAASGTDLSMYTGGGSFMVSATSPDLPTMVARLGGGAMETDPSDLALVIPLPMMGGLPSMISLTLVNAVVTCDAVSATNMMGCVLGGAITQQQIDDEIVPAILTFINVAIADAAVLDGGGMPVDCIADQMVPGDGTAAECIALSPDAICSAWNGVDMGVCVDSTDGVVGFTLDDTIDMDGDGNITATEISGLLGIVLVPDLDLDQSDTSAACMGMNPPPACEGVNDALSIGLALEAAEATLTGMPL